MTAFKVQSDPSNNADENQAWALLLAARSAIESGAADDGAISLCYEASSDHVRLNDMLRVDADLSLATDGTWRYSASLSSIGKDLLELYLPAIGTLNSRSVVVGHLGQSIDARIATENGDAFFVTGDENRKHLHRMRALSHAVIVGAGTVEADDPQLTTRSVSGESPVRVVIDPSAKTSPEAGLLNDGAAPTLLIHAQSADSCELSNGSGYERVFLPSTRGRLDVSRIIDALASRGLHRLFVEGGGVTVSGFLQANCLHRLQIATAPLLVGKGRAALQIPGVLSMQEALRPPYKLYRMGGDVLWDFDMRESKDTGDSSHAESDGLKQRCSIERLL